MILKGMFIILLFLTISCSSSVEKRDSVLAYQKHEIEMENMKISFMLPSEYFFVSEYATDYGKGFYRSSKDIFNSVIVSVEDISFFLDHPKSWDIKNKTDDDLVNEIVQISKDVNKTEYGFHFAEKKIDKKGHPYVITQHLNRRSFYLVDEMKLKPFYYKDSASVNLIDMELRYITYFGLKKFTILYRTVDQAGDFDYGDVRKVIESVTITW